MIASEIIKTLEKLIKEKGDVEVGIEGYYCDRFTPVTDITIDGSGQANFYPISHCVYSFRDTKRYFVSKGKELTETEI